MYLTHIFGKGLFIMRLFLCQRSWYSHGGGCVKRQRSSCCKGLHPSCWENRQGR